MASDAPYCAGHLYGGVPAQRMTVPSCTYEMPKIVGVGAPASPDRPNVGDSLAELAKAVSESDDLLERLLSKVSPLLAHPESEVACLNRVDRDQQRSAVVSAIRDQSDRVSSLNRRLAALIDRIEL